MATQRLATVGRGTVPATTLWLTAILIAATFAMTPSITYAADVCDGCRWHATKGPASRTTTRQPWSRSAGVPFGPIVEAVPVMSPSLYLAYGQVVPTRAWNANLVPPAKSRGAQLPSVCKAPVTDLASNRSPESPQTATDLTELTRIIAQLSRQIETLQERQKQLDTLIRNNPTNRLN